MSTAHLSERVAHYDQLRARGADMAVQHEILYQAVREAYGPVTAEFFDKEHALPYVTAPRLPWPMKPHDARLFVVVRAILSLIVGVAALFAIGQIDSHGSWWLGAAVVGTVIAAYVLVTVLPKLTRPRDFARRERLVQEFISMQQEHSERVERAATARRDARRLRELEDWHEGQ